MNWLVVARRDFQDARRSRILALAVGLFVALVALVMATTSGDEGTLVEDALLNLHGMVIFFMPIIMLVIAYLSIVGERETGRIKYLLGLPNRRWEVILGKFISRSLVAALAVVLSMAVGLVIIAARTASVPVVDAALMTLFMLFFAAVYVAIAVGISALVSSRARAMGGVIGVYVFFTVFWIAPGVNPQDSASYIVEELLGLSARPNLYEFVFHLSPSFAYSRLVNGTLFDRAEDGASVVSADAPFYLQEPFMLVILVGWAVLALGVGYLVFRDAELG
jgi:ABC-2 type transport system permease protein